MFTSARFKLTAWYLVIIMAISLCFSVVIYYILSSELDHSFAVIYQRYEIRRELLPPDLRPPVLESTPLDAAKDHIKLNLLYIDLFILAASATAGYFLAGRTLRPIQRMLDEQNRFVADASHELRTPLTALRTGIEVNLRDEELTLNQAKGVLRDNLEEVESLQSLSDNLLVLANGKDIKGELDLGQVFLPKIFQEAIDRVSPLAIGKGIKIESKIAEVSLEADQEKIIRLVIILLDNAIKYSNKDSLISVVGETIDHAHKVKIEIQDFGIGIAEKDLPFIFDRFYRTSKSRSKEGGYGLGLSIAKQIVDLHQGSIEVKSQVGKGTTFIVKLPLFPSRLNFNLGSLMS